MKQYFLCVILLIIGFYLFAGEVDNDGPANFTTEQMDRLASQFKTETGFEGEITYDLNIGIFSKLEGRFANVFASDTLSAKNSAKALIGPLQSYLKINPSQLVRWKVFPDCSVDNSYTVVAYQSVNGLEFQDLRRIAFSIGKNTPCYIVISTNLVPDLDFSTSSFISKERAVEIYQSQPGKSKFKIVNSSLLICPISMQGSDGTPVFRPCWEIIVDETSNYPRIYYIDAETGSILKAEDAHMSY